MEATSFVYDKLQPGRFRLSRILSCTTGSVKLEMKQFDFERNEPFYALSYVWGTAASDSTIFLNGHQATVKPNLFAALKAIRNASTKFNFNHKDLWVWIDALSINQNDNDEKSRQVPLMGHYYSRAQEVFVWLGVAPTRLVVDSLLWIDANLRLQRAKEPADRNIWLAELNSLRSRLKTEHGVKESEAEALWELYELPLNQQNYQSSESGRDLVRSWRGRSTESSTSRIFAAEHPLWAGLTSLTGNEWYQRMWTYQEIYLATDARLLFPNDSIIYWIMEHLGWIADELCKPEQPHFRVEARQFQDIFATTLYLANERASFGSPLALHLLSTRARRATNDRDIVYAILGLVTEETRRLIGVDYTLSSITVFINAMRVAVQESPELLAALWEAFSMSTIKNTGFPSWCPDFSRSKVEINTTESHLPIISQSISSKYDSYVRAEFMEPLTLLFNAWHIDKVSRSVGRASDVGLGNFIEEFEMVEESTEDMTQLARELVELTRLLQEFDSAILRDMSSINIAKLQRILDFTLPLLSDHTTDIDREALAYKLLKFCHSATLQSVETTQALRDISSGIHECHATQCVLRTFLGFMKCRNLLETASGKLGYSTLPVIDGDLVVYVPGGEELHVVSGDGRRYRGVARIEGYMGDSLDTTLHGIIDKIDRFQIM